MTQPNANFRGAKKEKPACNTMAHAGFPSRKDLLLDNARQHFACALTIRRTQRTGSKFKWRLTENRLGVAEIDKALKPVIGTRA
jgi:hypothetical protein